MITLDVMWGVGDIVPVIYTISRSPTEKETVSVAQAQGSAGKVSAGLYLHAKRRVPRLLPEVVYSFGRGSARGSARGFGR